MTNGLEDSEFGTIVEGRQYVTFVINEEEYALDSLHVREIIELSAITRVPHLPPFLKGVINLRGTIVPVMDLKVTLGMRSEAYEKRVCVIVTEYSKGVRGLIVDRVSDVVRLPDDSLSSPPSFGPRIQTDFIRAMGRIDNRLVLILDVEKICAEEEEKTGTDTFERAGSV